MKLMPAYSFLTMTWPGWRDGVGKSVSTLRAWASPVSRTTAAFIVDGTVDIERRSETRLILANRPLMAVVAVVPAEEEHWSTTR